jgi:hypothetical protein
VTLWETEDTAPPGPVALRPDDRLAGSRAKIRPPFSLDPTLCLYSPQDNVDALDHPRVRAFWRFIADDYEPDLPPGRAIALLVPCTKHKPYPTSLEHRRINAALLAAGFRPTGGVPIPERLLDVLDEDEDPAVLDASPLVGRERVVHRFVVSEPLGLVPYEFVYTWRGEPSVAASYDDPGLFEHRGTSVAPWRSDCTAVPGPRPGRWRWGDNERAAYVEMHNALSRQLRRALGRLQDRYERRIAWVAPGLTHRSFLAASADRRRDGIAAFRVARGRRLPLVGVNDLVPGLVEIHPTRAETQDAIRRLRSRLARDDPAISAAAVHAAYARGGGGATPLALPELLEVLVDLVAA